MTTMTCLTTAWTAHQAELKGWLIGRLKMESHLEDWVRDKIEQWLSATA